MTRNIQDAYEWLRKESFMSDDFAIEESTMPLEYRDDREPNLTMKALLEQRELERIQRATRPTVDIKLRSERP